MPDLKAAAKRKKKAKRKGPIEDLMESLRQRIRELDAEIAVRDNISNEVLRILREATGRRDFHSEMEAAEHAAKLLAEARRDGARARWYFDRKNASKVVEIELRCIQADDWWDYERWAKEIDTAMEGKSDDKR